MIIRLLFLGDIVGPPGVRLIQAALPKLRQREAIDAVIANGENASNGTGLSPAVYRTLRAAGVDAITLGDHVYKKFDLAGLLRDAAEPIVRPANFPSAAAGRASHLFTVRGHPVAVMALLGRTFMKPVDCPFAAADRVLAELPPHVRIIVVDMHAEATSDKYLMLHHLAGRVSAVLGTHTHVPTADEQIREGTAFQCDVGMCGPHDGILGRAADNVLAVARTFEPAPFDVAAGDVRLNGALLEIDTATGHCLTIRRTSWHEPELL